MKNNPTTGKRKEADAPIYKMMKPDKRKEFNSKYDKLIHASYIIEKLSGKLLENAMIAINKKD